jgi:hypothetical protein
MEAEHCQKHTLTWSDLDSSSFLVNSTLYVLAVDLLLYPSDLLATRLQADKFDQGPVRIRRLLMDILRREGTRGLFRGFSVNVVGHFPGQFLYYSCYEYTNERLRRLIPKDISPGLASFLGKQFIS